MIKPPTAASQLSDQELLVEVTVAAARERQSTAWLVALLAQLDSRRLYLGEGCSSLFTYCTQVLHLSEHAAYGRIEAARATRKFPELLNLLIDGSITLTTVTLLAPHLTPVNHREVLEEARHKSKRDVEYMVARLRPQTAVPPTVRKLPAPNRAGDPVALRPAEPRVLDESLLVLTPPSLHAATVAPVAAERYRVQFTVTRETHDKLRRVQDLLRHSIPNGDPAAIFDRALTLLVADLEKAKLAATARPRAARSPGPGSQSRSSARPTSAWQ